MAGAAPSFATVHRRSATPVTKTVASSQVTAEPGSQSTHSGATISSARRTPSAPIIVQRRSRKPLGAVSALSGPSSTAPKSRVESSLAPNTAATAKAAPLYPPPNGSVVTAACPVSATSVSSARRSATVPVNWAPHSLRNGGIFSSAPTARSRESATRSPAKASVTSVG